MLPRFYRNPEQTELDPKLKYSFIIYNIWSKKFIFKDFHWPGWKYVQMQVRKKEFDVFCVSCFSHVMDSRCSTSFWYCHDNAPQTRRQQAGMCSLPLDELGRTGADPKLEIVSLTLTFITLKWGFSSVNTLISHKCNSVLFHFSYAACVMTKIACRNPEPDPLNKTCHRKRKDRINSSQPD